jgi:L-lactate dehydrogenase complex protein LldE
LRVALFITCLNDLLFPATGRAVVRLLERLGCEVHFFRDQTCCGQMHANSGYEAAAATLARRFIDVFGGADLVVCPSASCVGTVRDQYGRLAARAGDAVMEQEVAALLPRVFELTEFLVDHLGVMDVGASFPHRVTLHSTCHSLRVLRLGERPRRLLEAVRGLELIDLPGAEECCGFGGTFAVKNPETSTAILTDKLHQIVGTRAEVCTAADNSCLMHIGGALRRQQAGLRVMHLAEILAAQQ